MQELEMRLRTAMCEVASIARQADAAAEPGLFRVRRRPFGVAPALAAASVAALIGAVGAGAVLFGDDSSAPHETVSPAEQGGAPPSTPTASRADVNAVVERMSAFWSSPGFGRVDVAEGSSVVTVLWKGAPAPAARSAASEFSGTGVIVEFRTVDYSQADMDAAGEAVFEASPQSLDGARVWGTRPNDSMSALVVEVVRPWSGSTARLEAAAGIPVVVELVDDTRIPLDN